jgi:hypothetical protein
MAHADPPAASAAEPELPADIQHPRGTLAIVIIFGVLFALGWLAIFFLRFLPGGLPQH